MSEYAITLPPTTIRAIVEERKTQMRVPVTDGERYRMGDVLWVKEDYCDLTEYMGAPAFKKRTHPIAYHADAEFIGCHRWRRAKWMPREASRVTLTITSVRTALLQSISDADILAEGCMTPDWLRWRKRTLRHGGDLLRYAISDRDAFRRLWDATHDGANSWDGNPLVFVYRFRAVASVDARSAA